MTQGIGDRPASGPPLKSPARPDRRENQSPAGPQVPSLAQFALNQTLHRSPPPEAGQGYRSLSIFKDTDSGRFVTLFRDGESGQVTEQIPDERALEFYARIEREIDRRMSGHSGVDVKA